EKRVFLVILFTSFSGSLVSRISGAVQFAAIWGSLMDPLLIIHGSVYWIGPLDMWINHSRKTTYTTDYEGFRAYLLTVTKAERLT
ncbi:hypothetical protein ACOS8J_26685, partial [Escherichia coli]